jgi:hypothetical protein
VYASIEKLLAGLGVLAVMFHAHSASAETFRCSIDREIAIGNNGLFEDNKEANKGKEFFIAIDNQTQKGVFSSCTNGKCGNVADVFNVNRYDSKDVKNQAIRMVVGARGQTGQLWSLEDHFGTGDYLAVSVSAMGQRSDTGFGKCRVIVQ